MTSKARVVPSSGLTTPRAELSGLVVLIRLMDKVVKNLEHIPSRCTILGDSTCTVAATKISSNILQPFFSNRVVEVLDTMARWGPESPVAVDEELS